MSKKVSKKKWTRKLGRWSRELDIAILYHDEAAMKVIAEEMRMASRKMAAHQ
jgi:hypothetical protein